MSLVPREQRSPKSLSHHPKPLLHLCNPRILRVQQSLPFLGEGGVCIAVTKKQGREDQGRETAEIPPSAIFESICSGSSAANLHKNTSKSRHRLAPPWWVCKYVSLQKCFLCVCVRVLPDLPSVVVVELEIFTHAAIIVPPNGITNREIIGKPIFISYCRRTLAELLFHTDADKYFFVRMNCAMNLVG